MIDLLVTKEQYDEIARKGLVTIERRPRRNRPKHKHTKAPLHGERSFVNLSPAFADGCGIKVGDKRRLRWKDTPKRGPEKVRGRIIVQAGVVAFCVDTGKWEVTFTRCVDAAASYFMAPSAGYTQNPEASIDPEAPVPYDPEVERIVADGEAAKRERRKAA